MVHSLVIMQVTPMKVDEGTLPSVVETKYGMIGAMGPAVGAFVATIGAAVGSNETGAAVGGFGLL